MRARELRDLTDDDLQQKLADTRQELFNLRFQAATGALDNSARLRLAKREIARILTVQRERETPVEQTYTWLTKRRTRQPKRRSTTPRLRRSRWQRRKRPSRPSPTSRPSRSPSPKRRPRSPPRRLQPRCQPRKLRPTRPMQ